MTGIENENGITRFDIRVGCKLFEFLYDTGTSSIGIFQFLDICLWEVQIAEETLNLPCVWDSAEKILEDVAIGIFIFVNSNN
jgi:hypothetical protein